MLPDLDLPDLDLPDLEIYRRRLPIPILLPRDCDRSRCLFFAAYKLWMVHKRQSSSSQLCLGRSTFTMISRKNGRRHMRSTTRVAGPCSSTHQMQFNDSSCSEASYTESIPGSPTSNGPPSSNEHDLTLSDSFDYPAEAGELDENMCSDAGDTAPKKRFRVSLFCDISYILF
jgi:hypothetical protein